MSLGGVILIDVTLWVCVSHRFAMYSSSSLPEDRYIGKMAAVLSPAGGDHTVGIHAANGQARWTAPAVILS